VLFAPTQKLVWARLAASNKLWSLYSLHGLWLPILVMAKQARPRRLWRMRKGASVVTATVTSWPQQG
jgi:hypothetical protein